MRKIFVAAPDGQAGGGMGRVKDYMLQTPDDAAAQHMFVPLVTRNGRGAVYSILLLLRAMGRLGFAAMRGEAAMLHVNLGDRGSIARKGSLLLFAKMLGLRTVLHLHAAELEQFYASASPQKRRFIAKPFRAADCIIVLGNRYRRWLHETLQIGLDNIHILNNGVAAPHVERKPVQPGAPQTILFLGNLIERKGVSDLLHALASLPKDVAPWRAVLGGGGDVEGYQAIANNLGIASAVEFAGWVDRPGAIELIGKASFLVLPSYDEGLPLVILEAMGMGLPVICSPVGVIPEVLADGETALFVDPGDRNALAAQIAKLLGDRPLQSALSVRAKDLFERSFSLRAFQSSLLAIYKQACGIDYVLPSQDAKKEAA